MLRLGRCGRVISDRPLRVALIGNFGVGNLGNDASLDALVRMVLRQAPDARITVLCPNPVEVARRLGVEAKTTRAPRPDGQGSWFPLELLVKVLYRLIDPCRALRMAGTLDVLLVPGTGILDDYGSERPSGWPSTLVIWFAAARVRGARTGLVSVGAGPLRHPASRRLASLVGRLADHRSFRDVSSRTFMTSVGVDVPATEVVPDIVFSLSAPPMPHRVGGRHVIGVPVMKYRGWYVEDRDSGVGETHIDTMSAFCVWLLDEGYGVRLITADIADGPATERVAATVIDRRPQLAATALATAQASDLEDLMRLVADTHVVVATRYHSVISALMCGRPTISLGYGAKNDDLMASVGLGAYCQHVEDVDQGRLRRQFLELVERHEQLSTMIRDNVSRLRDQLVHEEDRLTRRVLRSSDRYATAAPGPRAADAVDPGPCGAG